MDVLAATSYLGRDSTTGITRKETQSATTTKRFPPARRAVTLICSNARPLKHPLSDGYTRREQEVKQTYDINKPRNRFCYKAVTSPHPQKKVSTLTQHEAQTPIFSMPCPNKAPKANLEPERAPPRKLSHEGCSQRASVYG